MLHQSKFGRSTPTAIRDDNRGAVGHQTNDVTGMVTDGAVGKKFPEPGFPFIVRKPAELTEQGTVVAWKVSEDVVVKHEGLRSSGSCGPGTNPCSTYTLFLAEVLLGLECMLRHRLYRSLTCLRIAATHASRVYGQVTAGMRLTSST